MRSPPSAEPRAGETRGRARRAQESTIWREDINPAVPWGTLLFTVSSRPASLARFDLAPAARWIISFPGEQLPRYGEYGGKDPRVEHG